MKPDSFAETLDSALSADRRNSFADRSFGSLLVVGNWNSSDILLLNAFDISAKHNNASMV